MMTCTPPPRARRDEEEEGRTEALTHLSPATPFLIFLSSDLGIFFLACFSSILLPKASNLSSLLSDEFLAFSFSAFLRAFSAASIHSEPETVQRPSTTDQTSGQRAE